MRLHVIPFLKLCFCSTQSGIEFEVSFEIAYRTRRNCTCVCVWVDSNPTLNSIAQPQIGLSKNIAIWFYDISGDENPNDTSTTPNIVEKTSI